MNLIRRFKRFVADGFGVHLNQVWLILLAVFLLGIVAALICTATASGGHA